MHGCLKAFGSIRASAALMRVRALLTVGSYSPDSAPGCFQECVNDHIQLHMMPVSIPISMHCSIEPQPTQVANRLH